MRTLLAALVLSAALTGSALASTTAPIVIADGSWTGYAIQQPDEPAIPQTLENGASCSGCAIRIPPAQKLADNGVCSSCIQFLGHLLQILWFGVTRINV